MRFGVHIPTCIEGMMYPVPFAKPSDILPTALLCEAARVRLRVGQRPHDDPALRAAGVCRPAELLRAAHHLQLLRGAQRPGSASPPGSSCCPCATCRSSPSRWRRSISSRAGALILGVGAGAYREEYEALFPDARAVRRGTIVDEGMQALRLLFTERKATFRGSTVHFEEVECFPKPAQDPMPIYAGGNHPEVRRRAGQYGQGWMPAVLSPEEIARGSRTSTGRRRRPAATGRPSTSRRSSRCRSGAPARRPTGASGLRSSSSTSSRSRSRRSASRRAASSSAT